MVAATATRGAYVNGTHVPHAAGVLQLLIPLLFSFTFYCTFSLCSRA